VSRFTEQNGKILGKNYFRDPEVNLGFYSKKREGVADVDPKVISSIVIQNRLWSHLCQFQANHQEK